MSSVYKVRDLAFLSEEEIWLLPKERAITIEFEDGQLLETSTERTILSWYYWEIHRTFDRVPLLKTHHVGNGQYSNGAHKSTLERVYKTFYATYQQDIDSYGKPNFVNREHAWACMYESTNKIYNMIVGKLGEYVISLSIMDIVEVINHPEIIAANESVLPNQRSIDNTYDKVTRVIKESPDLDRNTMSSLARASITDMAQVRQKVSVRGFLTEIDSRIFPIPITTSFSKGIFRLYDSMIESRSASKALLFAKHLLADCEYFSRKLQQVCQSVRYLAPGDCGTTATFDWLVEPGELQAMGGVNYVDDDGVVKPIDASNMSLVGRTLRIRSPFGCNHPNNQTVCETCMGQIALSIPYDTNPGHISAIAVAELISQLVLSTKHVDGSSKVDALVIDDMYLPYIQKAADDVSIMFSYDLRGKRVEMLIPRSDARGLPTLMDVIDDIENSSFKLETVSELASVTLRIYEDDENYDVVTVPVSMGTRLGSISKPLLMYIAYSSELEVTELGDYVVDLTDFLSAETLQTAFVLPFKHTNMIDFKRDVEQFILTSDDKNKKKVPGLKSPKYNNDMVSAVKALMALVNSRIYLNLSHAMMIAYAMSVSKNRTDPHFAFPRNGEEFYFSGITTIMENRSLGVWMAYQSQNKAFTSPASYVYKNRMSHPADDVLLG